jgi:hypothetical protein
MKKFKHRICDFFGHKFVYYFSAGDSFSKSKQYRHCKRCGDLQEFRKFPDGYPLANGWYTLVERTKKGAKKFLKESNYSI